MTNATRPLSSLDAVAAIVARAGDLDLTTPLPEEHSYASLPLCVIDAVFSINVRYRVVENLVKKLTEQNAVLDGWPLFAPREARGAGTHTISDFLAVVSPLGSAWTSNQNRTSARGGILKSEATIRFAEALRSAGIDTFNDMRDAKKTALAEMSILSIPGQRSGISFSYFCILAGDETRIKADRMIQRFVAQATGLNADQITPRLASSYLSEAAARLQVTPARLDSAIWHYMARGEGATK